jgi:hypothetical protein
MAIPTCFNCGKKLRYFLGPKDVEWLRKTYPEKTVPDLSRGHLGEGRFCSAKCGHEWAIWMLAVLESMGVTDLRRE